MSPSQAGCLAAPHCSVLRQPAPTARAYSTCSMASRCAGDSWVGNSTAKCTMRSPNSVESSRFGMPSPRMRVTWCGPRAVSSEKCEAPGGGAAVGRAHLGRACDPAPLDEDLMPVQVLQRARDAHETLRGGGCEAAPTAGGRTGADLEERQCHICVQVVPVSAKDWVRLCHHPEHEVARPLLRLFVAAVLEGLQGREGALHRLRASRTAPPRTISAPTAIPRSTTTSTSSLPSTMPWPLQAGHCLLTTRPDPWQ